MLSLLKKLRFRTQEPKTKHSFQTHQTNRPLQPNLFYTKSPVAGEDIISNLYHCLEFILSYVKPSGKINLYPSYIYTYHFIQTLKEIHHPLLNKILNRSAHWFLENRIPVTETNFHIYKILALFEFKHHLIQNYLTTILPKILENHINNRKEIHLQAHLQAFDGFTFPMKEEVDFAITGAQVLLKYYQNPFIKDPYLNDKGKNQFLNLIKNSLNRAKQQIWNHPNRRNFFYTLSNFLYTVTLFHESTKNNNEFEKDINQSIIDIDANQDKTSGLWDNDVFQSIYIFNNVASVRNSLYSSNKLDNVFKIFYDNILENYHHKHLISRNVIHYNFLIMTALLQSVCKSLHSNDINTLVFRLRGKKLEI